MAPAPKRRWELPAYAREFKNKTLKQQDDLFQKIGIGNRTNTDKVHRKLFQFLCEVLEAAAQKTHRAVTTYKYFIDVVLRWSSNPNNLRSMPWFPAGENTLKTNLDPMLANLVRKGWCELESAKKGDLTIKTIALLPEKSDAERKAVDLAAHINSLLKKAVQDPDLPLPTRHGLEQSLGKTLSADLPLETLPFQQFNRTSLGDSRYRDSLLVQLDFGNGYLVLVTGRFFPKLYSLSCSRLLDYLRTITNPKLSNPASSSILPRLNNFLEQKFPHRKLSLQILLKEVGSETGNEFSGNNTVWAALTLELSNELMRNEREGPARIAKRQATNLIYAYLSHECDRDLEERTAGELAQALLEHLQQYKRYMTRDELLNRPEAASFADRYSPAHLEQVVDKLIAEHALQSGDELREGKRDVLVLHSAQIGDYYIHADHVLDIFQEELEQARDKQTGILRMEYINPWTDCLAENKYDEEVEHLMSSDEALMEDLRIKLIRQYPQFYHMYAFFLKNSDVLLHLCARKGVNPATYFDQGRDGYLVKTLFGLLGITREILLKEARNEISLFRKIWVALMKAFGGGKGGKSLWETVSQETRHSTPRETKNRRKRKSSHSPGKGKKGKARTGVAETDETSPSSSSAQAEEKRRQYVARLKKLNQHYGQGPGKEELAARWNTRIGDAAKQVREDVDRIIRTRIKHIQHLLNPNNMEREAENITSDPRFQGISNKRALRHYVSLCILDELKSKYGGPPRRH